MWHRRKWSWVFSAALATVFFVLAVILFLGSPGMQIFGLLFGGLCFLTVLWILEMIGGELKMWCSEACKRLRRRRAQRRQW